MPLVGEHLRLSDVAGKRCSRVAKGWFMFMVMRKRNSGGVLCGMLCALFVTALTGCAAVMADQRVAGNGAAPSLPAGAAPVGDEFVAGAVGWSEEVAMSRPRFDAGSVVQSSSVDENLRTDARVSISGSGNTLAVHIYEREGSDPVTLAATDTIERKMVARGTRRVLAADISGQSRAFSVTYERSDQFSDSTLGQWIIEHDLGQPAGGVFGDSAACELDPIDRSDVLNYSGDGFGIVGIEEHGEPKNTFLLELQVSRFYANFATRQVHADVLDRGSGRRIILTGRMSDDRTRFRGTVSTQAGGGVLVEVGTWGGIFCAQGARRSGLAAASAPSADAGGLLMTAAYEYEMDDQQVSTMTVMEARQSVPGSQDDIGPRNSVPSFSGASVGDRTYTKGESIAPLVLPAAAGGNGTVQYGLSVVPDGLSFNPATRTLTGIPTRSHTYEITYTAQDADGDSATLNFIVEVVDAPSAGASDDDDDGVGDDDGSGGDDDGVGTDDDDGVSDDDGTGGDDDGTTEDDDDGARDDDGSGGDDDGFEADDDDGVSDDDGTGGDDDGFVEDDDDGASDDDGSGGDDDGNSADDDDGVSDDDGSGGDDDGFSTDDDDGVSDDDDDGGQDDDGSGGDDDGFSTDDDDGVSDDDGSGGDDDGFDTDDDDGVSDDDGSGGDDDGFGSDDDDGVGDDDGSGGDDDGTSTDDDDGVGDDDGDDGDDDDDGDGDDDDDN